MAIKGEGWELELVRLGQHKGKRLDRTYGAYSVYIDGRAVQGLSGFICECQGPWAKRTSMRQALSSANQGRYLSPVYPRHPLCLGRFLKNLDLAHVWSSHAGLRDVGHR